MRGKRVRPVHDRKKMKGGEGRRKNRLGCEAEEKKVERK